MFNGGKSVVKSVTRNVTSKAIVYEKIRKYYYEKCNGKLFKRFVSSMVSEFEKHPLRGATDPPWQSDHIQAIRYLNLGYGQFRQKIL